MNANTKLIGNVSEAKVLAALIAQKLTVLLPFGDNERYDLVIDRDGIFQKVQCKTGRIKNGAIVFKSCSSSSHRKNGTKRSYKGEIDFFGVYCPDNDGCYLVPIKDATTNNMCSLRVEPSKNNQKKNVRWAIGYQI